MESPYVFEILKNKILAKEIHMPGIRWSTSILLRENCFLFEEVYRHQGINYGGFKQVI